MFIIPIAFPEKSLTEPYSKLKSIESFSNSLLICFLLHCTNSEINPTLSSHLSVSSHLSQQNYSYVWWTKCELIQMIVFCQASFQWISFNLLWVNGCAHTVEKGTSCCQCKESRIFFLLLIMHEKNWSFAKTLVAHVFGKHTVARPSKLFFFLL